MLGAKCLVLNARQQQSQGSAPPRQACLGSFLILVYQTKIATQQSITYLYAVPNNFDLLCRLGCSDNCDNGTR